MYHIQEHEIKAEAIDLPGILRQQKEHCAQEPYPSYDNRLRALNTLQNILIENQDKICETINHDFGNRPKHETLVLEIFPSLESLRYYKKHLKSLIAPRKHKISKWFIPNKCWVMPQPKGSVGIISPWNYPLFLTIAPLAAAIAAGNRVMIKLSEHTPKFSNLFKKLIEQNFLPSRIAIIEGQAQVGAEFSSLEFDHLFFTGSTEIGKKVYQTASKNLVPVTLELGGKSPAILLQDELQEVFIDRIWFGKLINSGQTCIAPDYIWLPRGESEKLKNISLQVIDRRFDKSTGIESEDYCSIINKTNYDRLIQLIQDAIDKGAQWVPFVEQWHSSNQKTNTYKISPGLLLNANHTMNVMQEEIFGPIMPVMEYDDFEHISKIMKLLPRPLACYLFTNDKSKQKIFIKNTISGALCLNNTVVHAAQESLPFGGIGHSGIGHYRGKYGFDTFSMLKPIYKQSKIDIFSKFYPPKSGWQKKLLNFMLKK